jgi:peptidoglycan/xylan/chitin deacetylase (PgdA/CDA1 family)
MALSRLRSLPDAGRGQEADGHTNDAFGFWKLAENWRVPLASHNEGTELAAEHYLLEKYWPDELRRPPSGLQVYYPVKRLLPAPLRHYLHSLLVRTRERPAFPGWPYELTLLRFMSEWLTTAMAKLQCKDGWHIGFWPDGYECSIVLTHDVEGPKGFDRIEAMAELEDKYGFRSAWNLPLAQYRIDWNKMERLRRLGFEIGAHGLSHDGRFFRSLEDFQLLAPKLEALAREHDLRGFRSPSTLRRIEWLQQLDFDFDSSFADTDPYEPQPGGCCSLFPFFLGRMVELPYTLPQDHTLLHLLRREALPIWAAKARWIASVGGMILTLVHPDYYGAGPYLAEYEELLKQLRDVEGAWRALPSQVAAWWQRRAAMRLDVKLGKPVISGPSVEGGVARRLSCERLLKWRTTCREF